MGVWDSYQERIQVKGGNKRNAALKREVRYINNRLPDNLSYCTVGIDGAPQDVAVINTDILTEKFIHSMPGEDIRRGALVYWMNSHWLVTERDENVTLHTRARMIQCNHLLKWVDDEDVIHEQWCVIEDGTKYLTGEYEDRNFIVTRGDSRIAMIIAKNEHTVKFCRDYRFLIDDPSSPFKLAYLLTKPFKLGGIYNGDGVYKFVLQEVVGTEDDNQELGIADYYKHFPKTDTSVDVDEEDITINPDNVSMETGKKVWL